ncbi:MAG: hypothetical protein IJ108_03315 [Eubacterium sp.]|nr:hypothetical protein [Eubacterium sp.]
MKKKMGEEVQIGIWDIVPEELPTGPENGSVSLWLGGKESIHAMMAGESKAADMKQDMRDPSCYLVLSTERVSGRADEIYAYQSAEVILDFILRHMEQYQNQTVTVTEVGAGVEVFVDISMKRSLLSCGAVYAQERGDAKKVLLVDMIPCSALTGLLSLPEPEKDFADLILSLRRKKPVHLSEYIVRSGNMDILPAACNPSVLYELSEEDFKLFLSQVTQINGYDATVILAGTPMPGIGYLFSAAGRTVCLQDDSSYSACRRTSLETFYRYSGGTQERWKDLILSHEEACACREMGEHLLFEWRNQKNGEQVRQELL